MHAAAAGVAAAVRVAARPLAGAAATGAAGTGMARRWPAKMRLGLAMPLADAMAGDRHAVARGDAGQVLAADDDMHARPGGGRGCRLGGRRRGAGAAAGESRADGRRWPG